MGVFHNVNARALRKALDRLQQVLIHMRFHFYSGSFPRIACLDISLIEQAFYRIEMSGTRHVVCFLEFE